MDTNHSPIISPLTMRESARGITLTSIYDEMLARRELSVMGNIETPMAQRSGGQASRQGRRNRCSRACCARHTRCRRS